ncbi:MAG: DUF4390 domain-containing protein [Candidatus Thiothrix moscowensis]|nr:DUF4390 domain-containing protein [Candidatus Thiothrix moscowensis]
MTATGLHGYYWYYRLMLSLLLLLCLPQTVLAEDGSIRFREFAIHRSEDASVLQASLKLDYQLNQYLRDGLLNGMALENEIRFELEWHNAWWLNSRKQWHTVKTELKYHPLSKQYQLVNSASRESWSFPNLAGALLKMGALADYPLPALPDNAVNNDAFIAVTARLTPKTLYLPLKIQSLFSDRYSLESEEMLWSVP